MEPDFYKVNILHYINPHLIWVEVVNSNKEEYVFEQIGIYGVLPLEPVLDLIGTVETKESDKWMPATTVIMKMAFSDAEEVWFLPTYIDRRSSIFDNNIHKFGNIIIKRKNGKNRDLTKQLLKSGFAYDNVSTFHTQLASGKLRTKLNPVQSQEVVKRLELYYKDNGLKDMWERSVKSQMSVYKISLNFESKLTTRNLEKHNRVNMRQLVENKLKDFEKCKDVDEVSVGRASHKKDFDTERTTNSSSLLKRKLAAIKAHTQESNEIDVIIAATKQFLEDNAHQKHESESENGFSSDPIKEVASDVNEEKTDADEHSPDVSCEEIVFNKTKIIFEEKKKIAFGPPEISPNKLTVKQFSISEVEKDLDEKVNYDNNAEIAELDKSGEDSDLNISITNLDLLKSKTDDVFNEEANTISTVECAFSTKNDFDKSTYKETHESKLSLLKRKCNKINKNYQNNNSNNLLYNGGNNNNSNNSVKSDIFTDDLSENVSKDSYELDDTSSKDGNISTTSTEATPKVSKLLQKKLRRQKELKKLESSSDTSKSMEAKKTLEEDSDDDIEELVKRLDLKSSLTIPENNRKFSDINDVKVKINVNPFKNLDGSTSVFVDKLISPLLLVHTKKNNLIQPRNNIRDIPFGNDISIVLRNMGVKELTRLQSVSWYTILRGHSTFMISPFGSGKTMGYLPAVCKLVSDSITDIDSLGPSCIIVCATAKSVADIERQAKMFLGLKEKVLACYSGMNELDLVTSMLNGCDLLITTPCLLVRLLEAEFGLDLRRLTTLVLDDCERLTDIYIDEVKLMFYKVKEMLQSRVKKELRVQIIVASRKWTGYLDKLAKKAPDTVVCFGAFQECVLYAQVKTTVDFIIKENKVNAVLDFLKTIDTTKRTVIVCKNDDEVKMLEKTLKKAKYILFSCNSTMTVQDLFNINIAWADYREPVLGPILLCCDGNLNHINVTDANYLIHYSLPDLFSMFCRRFAVLIDNYPSIFKENNSDIRIKLLLEEENVEQLPKILNFCKRCTNNVPEVLDEISKKVLTKKDLLKAEEYIPICDTMLALGECADFWNCVERHAIFKKYDTPKDWMPTEGTITFKILHYHTPTLFSARLLTNTVQNVSKKYAQNYSTLSLKMGMYYSKESNRRLHGIPKLGDVCAVAIKQNFYERCQILKILNHYPNGKPKYVLIKLLDEEKYERIKDIYLYYLPDELKNIETHVIRVRLANVQPKDKDVTFPDLATDEFKKITFKDDFLYLRGKVTLSISNCVFVDSLEACQDIASLNVTVVKHNFKEALLNKYAIPKIDHISTLQNHCEVANILQNQAVTVETKKETRPKFNGRWAYLEPDVLSEVYFASAENPSKFFVRLVKFKKCMIDLIKDINKYVEDNPEPLTDVETGEIVIAKFPDDNTYERARVEEKCDENKVKCFFVDQGDWRFVPNKHLIGITKKFVNKIPFQSIECSLVGIEPVGEVWSEFCTNWLCDSCYDVKGYVKQLYVKYFSKETAELTDGHKYGVALIDTYGDQDNIINQTMVSLNLAKANNDFKFLDQLIIQDVAVSESNEDSAMNVDNNSNTITDFEDLHDVENNKTSDTSSLENESVSRKSYSNLILSKPIRSVPLVTDDPFFDPDRWDVYNVKDVMPSQIDDKGFDHMDAKRDINDTKAILNTSDTKIDKEELRNESSNRDSAEHNVLAKVNTCSEHSNTKLNVLNVSLDSDDLSCPDTDVSDIANYEERKIENSIKDEIKDISKDNLSINYNEVSNETRKPKICWRQNNTTVYLKIMLIGVENYSITINERFINFQSCHNDLKYSFDFELYGGVRKEKCSHSNKGQYILVTLTKILKRNWLMLTKDSGIRKWIVYDVDSIDTSSDEEEIDTSNLEVIKKMHEEQGTDSDDDEFIDDSNFCYR